LPFNQSEITAKYSDAATSYATGTITAAGMRATLQFLKTRSDTRSLARPRILTLNNENRGNSDFHQTGHRLDPEHGGGRRDNSQSTAEAEREDTGVFLTVTPQANLITGEILMAVKPQVKDVRTGGTFGTGSSTQNIFGSGNQGNSIAFKGQRWRTPLFWAGWHG